MATHRIFGKAGTVWTSERVWNWLRESNGRSCAASLAIHLVVIGSLSLAMFRNETGLPAYTLISSRAPSEVETVPIDSVLGPDTERVAPTVEFESAGTLTASATAKLLAEAGTTNSPTPAEPGGTSPVPLDSPIEFERPRDLLQGVGAGLGAGVGNGMDRGRGMGNLSEGYAMPGGGKVVTKGRFSAWTVPTDPRPRQSYLIVIQVEWPTTKDRRTLQLRRFDLSGTIVGTDAYFQSIEQTGHFVPKASQVVVPVPGGEQNVQDVIRVHSKQLNESQELAIRF